MCETKVCSKCGKELSLDNFYKRYDIKNGYHSACKECLRIRKNELLKNIIHIEITEKYCKQCNTTKSITEFYKNKRNKDGYSSSCKTCSDKSKKDRANNFTEPSKNIIEKLCTKCNIIKPISEFYIDRYSTDGYNTNCNHCCDERTKNTRIVYDDIEHDPSDIKYCSHCKKTKSYTEFFVNRAAKDRLTWICKKCSVKKNKKYRHQNPELYSLYDRKHKAKRRKFGYKSINKIFTYSESHHLHLENSHDFVINIPCWLHRLYRHNSFTWNNMDSINTIALDFWINEELYKELYEL